MEPQIRETSDQIIARAVTLLVEGLKARVAESITATPTPNPDEVMHAAQAAAEAGYSTDAVGLWCKRGDIAGAWRVGKRGRWRFRRRDFEAFLQGRRRRRRLRVVRSGEAA